MRDGNNAFCAFARSYCQIISFEKIGCVAWKETFSISWCTTWGRCYG